MGPQDMGICWAAASQGAADSDARCAHASDVLSVVPCDDNCSTAGQDGKKNTGHYACRTLP